ncbi:putative dehydrogenase reductase protein [Botrytis fragariae]|uniref:Putative dehydrogenase reductase protein n=1 Tax=Botrytis fragariae TaxID=1964551 RepID=A0A8H6AWB9_9HELO|nr:putative dehydrogenase reductase protein [Botrytis fragariae]KAF5874714.1 putative dehydrogenase reductase protein [Botrytis fragariae]
MGHQLREHIPAVNVLPTFHLIEAEILDLSYEALVLQVDGNVRLDKTARDPAAWRARVGDGVVGGPNGNPPGQIATKLATQPTGPHLRDRCTMSLNGQLGTLGAPGAMPLILLAVRVDDPHDDTLQPPPLGIAIGKANHDHFLRRGVSHIMSRAMNIRRGIPNNFDPNDDDQVNENEWQMNPPISIAFPLIGCRTGYGFINAAENILSAIIGWYHDPRYTPQFGNAAMRAFTIQDIYLVVPPRTTVNVRILKPALIRSAWEKAWDRYLPPALGAPPVRYASDVQDVIDDQIRQHATTYWKPGLGQVLLIDGVDNVAGGFPLNLTPWLPENITDAWIRRNCKVLRGGRVKRVTDI